MSVDTAGTRTIPRMSSVLGASLLNPTHLASTLGLLGILAVVFAECGLLIGFFLPGDSLLFAAGLLASQDILKTPLWLLCALVSLAAIAGNLVGYWIGFKAGPAVFRKPESRLLRPEYVTRTEEFFDKYGAAAIVLARFVPIVRTLTSVMAGVGRMNLRVFTVWSIVGGFLWGTGVVLLGHWLGRFAFVRNNIEIILVGVVLLSVIPIWLELRRRTRTARG
jgi:membrane-associated protein